MRTAILVAGSIIAMAISNGNGYQYSDSTRLFLTLMFCIFFTMDLSEFLNKIFKDK